MINRNRYEGRGVKKRGVKGSRAVAMAALVLALAAVLLLTGCGNGGNGNNGNGGKKPETKIENPISLTISVLIDEATIKADSYKPIENAKFTAEEGSSVLDATKLYCTSNNVELTVDPAGTYITHLNGLNEKDYSEMTGWTYTVNGQEPSVACSEYVLKDGDAIVWKFVDFAAMS